MNYNRNRCGKFRIDNKLMNDLWTLSQVLAKIEFVPFHVEYLYGRNCMEYTGHSPLFEKAIGTCIPEYILTITTDKAGNVELVEATKK